MQSCLGIFYEKKKRNYGEAPMSNLSIFQYQNKPVRTVVIEGEPWFVAKDVYDALNIFWNGASRIEGLPENWKQQVLERSTSDAGVEIPTGAWLISEAGVYKVAFRSNKPEAEKFTDWVAEEVLPTIRKKGVYSIQSNGMEMVAEILYRQEERLQEMQKVLAVSSTKVENFFSAGDRHPGSRAVIKNEMEVKEDKENELESELEVGLTTRQWLLAKGILVTDKQYRRLCLLASQFYFASKHCKPCRDSKNRAVYYGADVEYIEQAYLTVVGIGG